MPQVGTPIRSSPCEENPQRVNKYMHFKELRFSGVDFPVPLSQMPKVERLNNLAINVFGYSKQAGIHPLYLSKDHTRDPINLLMITEVKDGKTISHYCWIKDFDKLCHDQTKHEHRLHSFASAAYPPTALSEHCKTTLFTAEELMPHPVMLSSPRITKKLGIFPKQSSDILRT